MKNQVDYCIGWRLVEKMDIVIELGRGLVKMKYLKDNKGTDDESKELICPRGLSK